MPLAESTREVFIWSGTLLSFIGFILSATGAHALRIKLLYKQKQILMLISISISSGIMCIMFVPLWFFWGLQTGEVYERVLFILATGFYQALIIGTLGLTFDRFLAVAEPFKQRLMVTNRSIKLFLAISWSASFASKIPFLLSEKCKLIYMIYLDVIVNTICISVQPFAYLYIYKRWKYRFYSKIKLRVSRDLLDSLKRSRTESETRLLHTSLLVMLCCFVSSTCDLMYVALGMSTPSSNDTIMSPIGFMLWNIVVALQSLVYIIIKPEIRSYFGRKFAFWRTSANCLIKLY